MEVFTVIKRICFIDIEGEEQRLIRGLIKEISLRKFSISSKGLNLKKVELINKKSTDK